MWSTLGGWARRRVLEIAAAAILGASAMGAWQSYGRPFPSLFYDPFGDFSIVHLPDWGTAALGVEGEDQIVSVDGRGVRGVGSAARAIEREVHAARGRGAEAVTLEIQRGERTFEVRASLRSIGLEELWWFWGLYVAAGALMLWSGLTAYRLARRRPGALAHLGLSVSAFVFLVTFFDYHTTRWLAPLFAASTFGNAVGLVAVALCFPDPPRLGPGARRVLAVAGAAAGLFTLALALAPALEADWRALREIVNRVNPWPLGALVLSVALRFRRAEGPARDELVSAAWGLAAGPALLAVAYLVMSSTAGSAFHLLLPFGVAAFPLAVGYALIRHNIFDTEHVLSRRLFIAPAALGGVAAAGCVWALLRRSLAGPAAEAVAAAVSLAVGGGTAAGVWTIVDRVAFQARARFRPAIETLADQLATLRDEGAIRANLVALVERQLDVERATFCERPAGPEEAPPWGELGQGRRAWAGAPEGVRALYVPLRSGGELFGALRVESREGGAPFSDEDLALLETMAGLGGLGLQNARALRSLDEMRRFEAAAAQGGQRATIDLLGAELAHEVNYPLNYFRHLLDRLAKGRPFQTDDVEIGREEVERLERLLAALRKLQLPALDRRPIAIGPVVGRVLTLVRGLIEERRVRATADVPAEVRVLADADGALQLFANLVRNAVQAAPEGGRVEIVARLEGGVVIEVRDDGSGVPERIRNTLFRPWVGTRPGGSGLGLAVSQRLATGFGWKLNHLRQGDWTVFRIEAPLAPADGGEGGAEKRP